MTLGLIWAQDNNGVIGFEGTLPWRVPEDLGRFRDLTLGTTVLMGRRTWDSLPDANRPLPKRRNVVLSRQRGLLLPGAEVAHSLEDALQGDEEVWVIGGADIFALTMPRADRLEVTYVDVDGPGDTFAPTIDATWRQPTRQPESLPAAGAGNPMGGSAGAATHGSDNDSADWLTSKSGLRYRFVSYVKA